MTLPKGWERNSRRSSPQVAVRNHRKLKVSRNADSIWYEWKPNKFYYEQSVTWKTTQWVRKKVIQVNLEREVQEYDKRFGISEEACGSWLDSPEWIYFWWWICKSQKPNHGRIQDLFFYGSLDRFVHSLTFCFRCIVMTQGGKKVWQIQRYR